MIHEGLPARSGPLAALARQALDDLEGNNKMARQRLARNKSSQ